MYFCKRIKGEKQLLTALLMPTIYSLLNQYQGIKSDEQWTEK